MKLQKIELDDDEYPESITVQMTLDEAVWIGLLAGKQRGSSPHNGIHSCLIGNLFNRFFDNGIVAVKEGVVIPPIVYKAEENTDES